MATLADDLIQQLQLRPKCYISLNVATFTITRSHIQDPSKLLETFTGGGEAGPVFKELGAVQRLEINSTRDVNVWRELNYLTAGKPVESYPGLTSYELSLERVVLYESMLLDVFKFDNYDIIKQNRPLTIKLEMYAPSTITQDVKEYTKTWYIFGVWFKSNPMAFDVTDVADIRIIQDVDAVCAGIIGS